MLLGVAAGAFGAHSLEGYFERYPALETTYETAVRYHIYHALALLFVAWAAEQWPHRFTRWAGFLILAGVSVFSLSLYMLVATRVSVLGAITPIGGLLMLSGWACLFIGVWRQT